MERLTLIDTQTSQQTFKGQDGTERSKADLGETGEIFTQTLCTDSTYFISDLLKRKRSARVDFL